MSKARAAALRAEVHQATADYIDAAIDVAVNKIALEHRRIAGQIEELQDRAARLETAIANIENTKDAALSPDDKYALTKRKLVNLLDKLGIE
jgi:prefoldin subunit 5